jgi:hypothetical protein
MSPQNVASLEETQALGSQEAAAGKIRPVTDVAANANS